MERKEWNILDKSKSVESFLYASDKERIVRHVMRMGQLAGVALKDAVEAVITADEELAEKVVAGDDEIDTVEEEIDQECLRSIAMRQPVREELRFIFAVLKTITDLERIGDQAVNIARWALELKKYPRIEVNPVLGDMRKIAGSMLQDAMEAFRTSDGNMSAEICARDDLLDRNYSTIFNEFIDLMASSSTGDTNIVRAITGQMWIARHLERTGDHVTNIAERVYFMDKGETLTKDKERALLAELTKTSVSE
ncbi:MAG: phosphate signaling complex protein PhoU [Synergistaceae bacterium]|jgi:phosphate transport system protein|nr:phosphate signaling complex protein PhoU [Synergistaceae bacterium]